MLCGKAHLDIGKQREVIMISFMANALKIIASFYLSYVLELEINVIRFHPVLSVSGDLWRVLLIFFKHCDGWEALVFLSDPRLSAISPHQSKLEPLFQIEGIKEISAQKWCLQDMCIPIHIFKQAWQSCSNTPNCSQQHTQASIAERALAPKNIPVKIPVSHGQPRVMFQVWPWWRWQLSSP